MKQPVLVLVSFLAISVFGFARTNSQSIPLTDFQRVSIGLRGGLTMMYGNNDMLHFEAGGNVALDIQYASYWNHKTTNLGFLIGVSARGRQTQATINSVLDQYSTPTDNGTIDYTISATNIYEVQNQLAIEVPVMFSLVDQCGVFFNFGPRFAFPVWSQSQVSFANGLISAYFPEEGVTVLNEVITGQSGNQSTLTPTQWNIPLVRLALGCELGSEFALKSGNTIALGVYGDCSVASFYKTADAAHSFIHITEPSNVAPASIQLLSPCDVYASKLGMFDVGIKLTYHFNFGQ